MSGSDRRDLPFLGRWQIEHPEALRELMQWPHARTPRRDRVEAAVIAEALHAGRGWVSYSRRKNWYAKASRYLPPELGYGVVIAAVDRLHSLGLVEHDRKRPSPEHRYQSRFRASTLLLLAAAPGPPLLRCRPPRSLVILRDKDGHPVDFRDNDFTRAAARNVATIEEGLAGVAVDVDAGAPYLSRQGYFLELQDRRGDPYTIHIGHVPVARIFNTGWGGGGRFAGPPYQSLPRRVHEHLTIDGEPTEEADFGQMHARLLCARAGLEIDEDDLFEIPGFDRGLVKRVFYILINAPSLRSALAAIADERPRRRGVYQTAARVTEAIKAKFPKLAPYLHTGIGLELMRVESDVAESVILRLLRRGVVALPVHDSFVGQARKIDEMRGAMADAWEQFLGPSAAPISTGKKTFGNKGLQQNGITTGERRASGVPSGPSSGPPSSFVPWCLRVGGGVAAWRVGVADVGIPGSIAASASVSLVVARGHLHRRRRPGY
jgi:hypothetical protein